VCLEQPQVQRILDGQHQNPVLGLSSAIRNWKTDPVKTTRIGNQISAPEHINCYRLMIVSVPEPWSLTIRHTVVGKSNASTLAAASSCMCGST
jgi:hypothetical protein